MKSKESYKIHKLFWQKVFEPDRTKDCEQFCPCCFYFFWFAFFLQQLRLVPNVNIFLKFLLVGISSSISNMTHQSRLKVLQKLYIINNVIFRPHWLKPLNRDNGNFVKTNAWKPLFRKMKTLHWNLTSFCIRWRFYVVLSSVWKRLQLLWPKYHVVNNI